MVKLFYDRGDVRMKNNIFTYAYKGFLATIYFLIGKKDKIRDLFGTDDLFADLDLENTDAFVKRDDQEKIEHNKMIETEKIHFRYKARDKKGKIVKSTFDAYNIEQAKKFLSQEGLEVLEIKARSKYDIDITIGRVLSTDELAFSLTQLSTYIKAGISLVDSIRILARQATKPEKRKVYELIIYDLLAGDDFSDALARQPKVFPKLLVNMVKSAELTGDLPHVLDDMSNYYTSIAKTKKEIRSAMTYPVVVLMFAVIVVTFVLIYVVPQYQAMFSSYGVGLPKITQMTLAVSNFMKNNLVSILIVLIIILLVYMYAFKNFKSFRLMMQTFYLHIPVVKNIIMYSELSMFTKTFSSLLNHGVYITDSMDVLLKVSDNEVYKKIIEDTVKNLNRGGKISETFKDHWAIPNVAYEMIVTGENTGKLGDMMEKVYQYYDDLHTNTVSQIKSLIEPILIVFLAGSVGIIILSIILPMFEAYEVIS